MITFKKAITVTPQVGDPITIEVLDYSVTYDNFKNKAVALLKQVRREITLWEGAEYIAAGQFTDEIVEARINKILGKDPVEFLNDLLLPSLQRKIKA